MSTGFPSAITGLKEAEAAKDYGRLRIAAHGMKSILKFNGVLQVDEIAEMRERSCQNNAGIGLLPDLIEELDALCKRAAGEMQSQVKL